MAEPRWLLWAKRLQAIAQTGLAYGHDDYDMERYHELSAIAVEITANHSTVSADTLTSLFDAENGYPTPKVDVRAVVFDGSQLLLVKERSDGLWTLPGGWADVNESPSEAIAREVLEESGYRVKPARLLALYDRSRHPHEPVYFHHIYKLFFECVLVDGQQAEKAFDIDDVGFFSPQSLPSLSLSRILPQQITRLTQLHDDPSLPPDFD